MYGGVESFVPALGQQFSEFEFVDEDSSRSVKSIGGDVS